MLRTSRKYLGWSSHGMQKLVIPPFPFWAKTPQPDWRAFTLSTPNCKTLLAVFSLLRPQFPRVYIVTIVNSELLSLLSSVTSDTTN